MASSTDSTVNDFEDFAASQHLTQLLPELDFASKDIFSYPLLLVQVIKFSFFAQIPILTVKMFMFYVILQSW